MNKYPVLQSGFVAFSSEGLTLPNPVEPTVREAVIFKQFKSPLLDYFYSKEVTEMFNRWSANKDAMREFEFRERILKSGLRLFGTKNFRDWLDFQHKVKALSPLHGKFILETVEHIVTGAPRKIESVQWINLLEAGDQAKAVHVDPREFLKIRKGAQAYEYVPQSFEELILTWTKTRTGFEDLLITLYVIFGQRARQNVTSDLNQ